MSGPHASTNTLPTLPLLFVGGELSAEGALHASTELLSLLKRWDLFVDFGGDCGGGDVGGVEAEFVGSVGGGGGGGQGRVDRDWLSGGGGGDGGGWGGHCVLADSVDGDWVGELVGFCQQLEEEMGLDSVDVVLVDGLVGMER